MWKTIEVYINMQNHNATTMFKMAVVLTTFTLTLHFGFTNLVFSQAVDLIPLKTGNETLDSSIPFFYGCIEKAVDLSENAPQQAPYFEDEPTKNEMRGCYQVVFIDKNLTGVERYEMTEDEDEKEDENKELK
jgi:hypothetical protein